MKMFEVENTNSGKGLRLKYDDDSAMLIIPEREIDNVISLLHDWRSDDVVDTEETLEAKEKVLKLLETFNNEAHDVLEPAGLELGLKWKFKEMN